MAKISTYPNDSNINGGDKLIGTDVNNADATKNFLVSGLATYIQGVIGVPTLQQVSTSGNTTTLPLKMSSLYIKDSSTSLYGQVGLTGGSYYATNGAGNEILNVSNDLKFGHDPILLSALVHFSTVGLTTARTYFLPNSSGYLTTSVNGVTPSSTGNITLPSFNLNQVLTAGNTSSQIASIAALRFYDAVSLAYYELTAANNEMLVYNSNGDQQFSVSDSTLKFGLDAAISPLVTFDTNNVTTARAYEMPDDDGTFVLSVNGTAPDAAGNVTIATSAAYNVWSGVVEFISGGAGINVIQQLENTTGATMSFSISFGSRFMNASSPVFVSNKTVLIATPYKGTNLYNVVGTFINTSSILVDSFKTSDSSASLEFNQPFFIEVRIYP